MDEPIYIVYTNDEDFVLNKDDINSGGGGSYTLPIASNSTLGGVKIGSGLTINQNGILSTDNVFMITFNSSDAVIDKTYAEVEKEFLAGKICIIDFTEGNREEYRLVTGIEADKESNLYSVANIPISQAYCLVTNSKDGYPAD